MRTNDFLLITLLCLATTGVTLAQGGLDSRANQRSSFDGYALVLNEKMDLLFEINSRCSSASLFGERAEECRRDRTTAQQEVTPWSNIIRRRVSSAPHLTEEYVRHGAPFIVARAKLLRKAGYIGADSFEHEIEFVVFTLDVEDDPIKYIRVNFEPVNRVGDAVEGYENPRLELIGPLRKNQELFASSVSPTWRGRSNSSLLLGRDSYGPEIDCARVRLVEVEYRSGRTYTYVRELDKIMPDFIMDHCEI